MSDAGDYDRWQGCHRKVARGDGGAAILGHLRTDPVFDSGDRGPGTTRERSLYFRGGRWLSEGGEEG